MIRGPDLFGPEGFAFAPHISMGDIFFAFRGDSKQLEVDAKRAGEKAGTQGGKSFGDKFKAQMTAGNLGGGLMAGLGIAGGLGAAALLSKGVGAVTDAIGDSLNAAADFEEELGIINTVAKLSEDQLEDLGSSIQSLAVKAGKPTKELTSAFYDLVSAGVDADDAMKVLEDSTTLATGALSTTGEAVDLITTTLNAFKLEASESTRVIDVFAQTVAAGKVTAAELAATMSTIAPIAAAAGVSFEEVAAGYATMTAQGTPAAKAAVQMQAAITALLKPNTQLIALQKTLGGVTFETMLREQGLAVTLDAVRKAAGGNTAAITAALGSTEAYNAMLQMTGDNQEAFNGNLEDMRTAATEGGVAVGMMEERTDTYRFKQDRMNAAIEVLNQKVGAFIVGPAGDFLDWMADVISGGPQASAALEAIAHELGLMAEDGTAAAEALETFTDRVEKIPGYGRLFGVDFFPHETEFSEVVESLTDVGKALGLTQDDLRILAERAKENGVSFEELEQRMADAVVSIQEVEEAERNAIAITGTMGGQMLRTADNTMVLAGTMGEAGDAVDESVAAMEKLEQAELAAIAVTGAMGGKMLFTADGTMVLAKSAYAAELALLRQSGAAERLAEALGYLAGTSLKDLRESFKETRKALRAAFEAPPSMRELLKQERALIAARNKALRLNDEEAFAIAETALLENRAAQESIEDVRDEMRSINAKRKARRDAAQAAAEASKAARADFVKEQVALGLTTEAARKLWKQTQKDHGIDIPVDSSALMTAQERALALFGILKKIGGSGALTDIRDDRPDVPAGGKKKGKAPRPGGWDGDTKTPYPRASGGPVRSGLSYLVGERGPELFLPDMDGRIIDHSATEALASTRSGGGNTLNIDLDVHGSPNLPMTPLETVQQLRRAARLGVVQSRQASWAS